MNRLDWSNPVTWIVAGVMALTVVGCGGDAEPAVAPEPTATATSTPTPAESPECVSAVEAAESLAAAYDTVTAEAVEELNQLADRVEMMKGEAVVCHGGVVALLDEAAYRAARAAAAAEACSFLELCPSRKVTKEAVAAAAALRDAAAEAMGEA